MDKLNRTLGVNRQLDGTYEFRVWAPHAKNVTVEIINSRENKLFPMTAEEDGYFYLKTAEVSAGNRYYYHLDKGRYADPAADYQPEGPAGPSEIVDFPLEISTLNRPFSTYIIYELHVGTFSEDGTFAGVIPHLDELQALGITAIEIMPVAQFSGARNWGYDGVLPYAVQNTYGGPLGLKELVAACHQRGLAVILDVVYNHIGPEYNYLEQFGDYFTDKYHTPWGKALNFDDRNCHHVRRYFIENALHWFQHYGIDALRLDALHAIVDDSAYPFLEQLSDAVKALGKAHNHEFYLIAESSANDTRLIRSKSQGGFALNAQWNDEFHHALHTLLTGEQHSYYQDYGHLHHFAKAYAQGYVYSGDYSKFRNRPHGVSSKNIPARQFIVFMQNHDQIGNRPWGDRLSTHLDERQIRLYLALLLFSPYIPMIYMGEEYAETAPFLYFTSHDSEELNRLVYEGRSREFSFIGDHLPNPHDEAVFKKSVLNHTLKKEEKHARIWSYCQEAIRLRTTHPVLSTLTKKGMKVRQHHGLLFIHRQHQNEAIEMIVNISPHPVPARSQWIKPSWFLTWDSNPEDYDKDTIAPFTLLLYTRRLNHDE
ncbi:MAG: malto-oligosyltrehalose trehalohydrolase [Legionella sp.]|nr:malto-oligosyltrehalose trehalohydrolase [Legionella sp.]